MAGRNLPFSFEVDQEVDGRWIVSASEMPGVMAYGSSPEEAFRKAWELARQVSSDGTFREHGDSAHRPAAFVDDVAILGVCRIVKVF